ncbi:MAG: hypothetical protein KJO73_05040 [Croceitalea sp.]|nr:hypothetical protein [Croceitalea sp.]
MKQVGIWMDKEKAHCLFLNNGKEEWKTIPSEMEFFNPKGGSRSKTRWGPQDVVQDSKYLEREKHQLKNYFNKLVNALGDVDELILMGPAETAEKFLKELNENHHLIGNKVKKIEKADSMTENQVKAKIRETFGH